MPLVTFCPLKEFVRNAPIKVTGMINDTGHPLQQIGRVTKFHAGHVCHNHPTTIPVYTL